MNMSDLPGNADKEFKKWFYNPTAFRSGRPNQQKIAFVAGYSAALAAISEGKLSDDDRGKLFGAMFPWTDEVPTEEGWYWTRGKLLGEWQHWHPIQLMRCNQSGSIFSPGYTFKDRQFCGPIPISADKEQS